MGALRHPLVAAGVVALAAGLAPAALAETVEVPSGQEVAFDEVLRTDGGYGLIYRFRFVAPAIADGSVSYEDAAADILHLCTAFALERLPTMGPRPSEVVISLADRSVPFGDTDPDVVQYFDVFRPEEDGCVRIDETGVEE